MNKYIKRLLCYSAIGIAGVCSINNIDARLPRYMAQRAAELLIEKSGLKVNETLAPWVKIKEEVETALSQEEDMQSCANNIVYYYLNYLRSYVINNTGGTGYDSANNKEKLKESIERILAEAAQKRANSPTNIVNPTSSLPLATDSNDSSQATQKKGVLQKAAENKSMSGETAEDGDDEVGKRGKLLPLSSSQGKRQIAQRAERHDEQLRTMLEQSAQNKPLAVALTRIARAFCAHEFIQLLYTTQHRDTLAKWMKQAHTFNVSKQQHEYHPRSIDDFGQWEGGKDNETRKLLKNLMQSLSVTTTEITGEFINNLFPCWTGTFTCFMMNTGVAQAILRNDPDNAIKAHKQTLRGSLPPELKIFSILFILELVDDWNTIQRICDVVENGPQPNGFQDQYTCVPVPNTMYNRAESDENPRWQGSCLVSTIHNLLNILCKDNADNLTCSAWYENTQCKEEIKQYLSSDGKNRQLYYEIPGMTSPENLRKFAEKIELTNTDMYQPKIDKFIIALNNTLNNDEKIKNVPPEADPSYIYNILAKITAKHDLTMKYGYIQNNNAFIEEELTTNAEGALQIQHTAQNLLQQTMKTLNLPKWYNLKRITITDRTVGKMVTIDIGQIGRGWHAEITNIQDT